MNDVAKMTSDHRPEATNAENEPQSAIIVGAFTIQPHDNGMITVSRGDRAVTIDTSGMSREDVSTALVCAASLIDEMKPGKPRRAAKWLN